jgi:MoxR-like ATPase
MSSLSSPLALAQRLQQEMLARLKHIFVGKDEIIDVMGVCLAARENLFLLGPPGTAKSAIVQALGRQLAGRSFDYLLTRFTEPNEIFGPFDIRKLREGDLVTNTAGMLPEADFVFLDELLNANSAILNSLLLVLNERIFRRGQETRPLPALLVVGASNQLPEEEALRALFDRFLLRVRCGPVPEAQLGAVLEAGWRLEQRGETSALLTADQVREIQQAVTQVDLSPVLETYLQLVVKLRRAGLAVSDRRAVRSQRVIAGSALLAGRTEARVSDLWVLRHIWDREEQMGVVDALVNETLRHSEAATGDHPRAYGESAPNPDALAAALELLAERLAPQESEQVRSAARDGLRSLASSLEWVKNDTTRAALQQRVEQLWKLSGTL